MSEEQIEQDELNQHECMLPLMRLIDHMQHNKITPEVPQVLIHTTRLQYYFQIKCKCHRAPAVQIMLHNNVHLLAKKK